MQVHGPAHLHGPQALTAPHTPRPSEPSAASSAGQIQDELSISDAGRLMEQAQQMPDIRWDRVNQLRAQIAEGTYETDDKMQVALGRMLNEIG